jgi:hypothetical protein
MTKSILAVALATLCGCGGLVDSDRAVQAVEDLGFSDVRVVDRSNVFPQFDGCGEKEAAAFSVQGKNPSGKTVQVTVCCGLMFKGCTVRH